MSITHHLSPLTHGRALSTTLVPEVFRMEQDDVALVFSDGLTEATNKKGEEFGLDRLRGAMHKAVGRGNDAGTIRKEILASVDLFVGGAEAHDDITIVVIKRL